MTPEVKKRIEQIRQGIVPDGYTKTRSEITPTTWTPACLGDIYTERKEPGNESLPLLTVSIHSGVSDGELDEDELPKKVKRIEDKSQYKRAATGDLVFNMMRAWQGAIGTVRTEGMVSPAYIVAKPNGKVYPPFMDYYMKAPRMVGMINRQSYGVTDFRKRLYWDSFALIPCVLPPVSEQKKIAQILATQDKVIELKEKLLVEKRQQKKYLIQQLLTGKKRLHGFHGEWKREKLGKLFAERNETQCAHLELLAITGTQGVIPRSKLDLKDNSSEDKSKYLHICMGDIGYNTMRMWQGVSAYSNYEGIVSPAYTILKPKGKVNAKYFSYLFKLPEVVFTFFRFSQGLVDDTRNLKYENFKTICVTYPEDIQEQNVIASILEKADQEIDLLCQAIEQEKKKKKALMQLLLTGIVKTKGEVR